MPAIFRGIHLDPLAAGNISYLLWIIMGYRLAQAVLVLTVGRLVLTGLAALASALGLRAGKETPLRLPPNVSAT